ncbi:MAG: PLxRFG domain-containing protein [Sphingobium sp.]
MPLAEKTALQAEVTQLESDLRKMRTSIFDAEDAIAEAIKSGNVDPFKAFAELFPRAASVLGEHIKDASETKQPATIDELIGAVDAGYKAHFDYAGADGRTVWIEKTDNGWVMKSRDDGSDATITKGGGGPRGGWAKYEALDEVESNGKHRFTEWKPLVDTTDVQDNAPPEKDDNPPANTLSASLYEAIKAGNMPKDNPALRKLVESFDGKPADTHRMKAAQESLEVAIVMTARDVVGKKEGDQSTFDALLRLYQLQPNLNIRTSTSIANQAYSTPAPLAFLASRLAGINQSSVVHEPTAGTGMLLIGADPVKAIVNELNDLRVGMLTEQGFKPTQLDASTETLHHGKPVDVVITNPPFGSVKDASGNPIKVKIDNYNIGQIDHLIAARALADMKDDGRAVLILGANKVSGGLSTDDRIFFNWLYAHYNVTGHFEVNGDMYARQGAGWPVRVIVIAGRGKSNKVSPIAGTIQRADTWSQVYDNYKQILDSSGQHDSAAGARPGSSDTIKAGSGSVRADSGTKAPATDRPVATGGRGSDGNVAGTSAGVVPDSANPAAGPVGAGDDGQRLFGQPSEPSGLGSARPSAKPSNSGSAQPAGATTLAAGNEFQVPYTPRSARKDEGVLIPSNMAQPTQDALSALEDAVGDIDEFAATELGYKSVDELHQALMGLQVDSVATAIHQIKQGKAVVIADQTGIGKGRQAAAIIRWAAKNGMTPVFVSVKPSLFTDMYGDLADIGTHDIRPFIMNVDASIAHEDGSKLFTNKAGVHKARIRNIADSGALPGDSNALFMTYSQINVTNVQREAMMALAPNAVFILDESHNAAGDSATGQFVIGALGMAKGVTYLSATYAKRPDNMPLYFKTDIGDAAADADGLALAMASGGLPLQTVVSHNLVKAGQMFRRERSYDGVSIASKYDTPNRAKHEGMSNEATTALRAIVAADHRFHSGYVKEANDKASSEGGAVIDNAGNKVSAGVQHTEFSSVVHNFIKQMLLGLKAQTAADEAIASLKRNEKPIIAVENTMGSFLNEYAADNGIAQGDDLGSFDYRTVLSRALARTRVLTEVNQRGEKTKRTIRLDELDPQTRAAYDRAQAVIDKLKLDIPVSPIDWIRAEIIRAGYSVAEITGRNLSVDYTDNKKPTLTALDLSEQKDKVNTTRQFNSGKLDALILNVAGSTGISLHASEKFADQRQRHMVVAQAAGDINIFMQMLGRVHRTGQVTLPKYTILSVDLPTEKRPTAVLSGKMKSLNANTSSNTESATSVESLDILNKYGDQIVNQYLADNLALARAMDIAGEISIDGTKITDDIARKATGRLALQPIETQHNFYDDVESQYHALIEYLNKTNQNDLVPRTFDFDAKEMRQEVLFDGPNKASPFGEDAIYGEYSIKAQGAPMKPAEIRAAMDAHLDGKTPEQHVETLIDTLLTEWATEFNSNRAKHGLVPGAFDEDKYLSYLQSVYSEDVSLSMTENAKQAIAAGRSVEDVPKAVLANNADAVAGIYFIRTHRIGDVFRVDINDEPYNAIITNLKSTHKKAGNPFSKSKIQLTVSVNGALRSLSVPATQFQKIEVSSISSSYGIDRLFKEQPPNQRETAKIVTGNLLAAYGELQGARGTIITFTKEDGTSEQGILLPKLFDYTKNTRGDYRLPTAAAALKFLQQSNDQNIGRFGIQTRDGVVRVLPEGGGVKVQVPRSKLKGAKYFLDKDLISAAGDFASSGSSMVATVRNQTDAVKALDLLMKKQALYALPSMAEEAKALTGDKGDTAFSRVPDSGLTPAESIKRVVRVQAIVNGIKAKWNNAPEIIVVADMQDAKIPQRVRDMDAEMKSNGASGEPRGFISQGKVYIVAGQHKSVEDVITTLAHETLGHAGLRGLYGDALKPILGQIVTMRRAEVDAKVKEYGFDPNSERDLLRAAEEVLANFAQTQPEMGFVKRAIAAIRNWLRDNGLNLKLTDADIIAKFILPARAFIENGRGTGGGRTTAFSRSSQTDTETSIDVPGFSGGITIKHNGDGSKTLNGTAKIKGEPYFFNAKAVQRDDGTYRLNFPRWETFTGKGVRGAANVQLEELTDVVGESLGQFDPSNDDIMFSRTVEIRAAVSERAADLLTSQKTFNNWWHKSVGTQYHKAHIDADFRKAFNAVQSYLSGMSAFANSSADLADRLIPQLNSIRDLWNTKPPSQADIKAISGPIFAGTLEDETVYGAELLRSRFKLTDGQIDLYVQFRAAVDKSLDDLGKTDILRYAGADVADLRAEVLDAPTASRAALIVSKRLQELGKEDDVAVVMDKGTRVADLKAKGYAPLTRFGKYTVHVTKGDEQLYFGLFESESEANATVRDMNGDTEFAGASFTQGVLSAESYKLFNGLSPDTLELFAGALGVEKNEIVQEYIKLAKSNRDAMKRMLKRKGIAGFSEDVPRILASFITSNARQSATNVYGSVMDKAADAIPKEKGDVKDEAIKMIEFARNPTEDAAKLRGMLFVQYIGGSVASAMVNLTQPITMSFPYLNQFSKHAGVELAKAMKQATLGGNLDPDLKAALKRAEVDGVVSPQEIHQLQAEAVKKGAGVGALARMFGVKGDTANKLDDLSKRGLFAWGSMFSLAEQFNRRSTFIAAYNIARQNKEADPFAFAEKAVVETQGIYNRGNRPDWARGAPGALIFTFKQYSISYMEFLKRLPPKERAIALAILVMAAGLQGIPFADDLDDLIDTLAQQMGYAWNTKAEKEKFAASILGESGADFVLHGTSALPGFPLDFSGRLGMSNLLPGTGMLLKNKTDKAGEVLDVFGVAGGVVKDALRGEVLPIAVRNMLKAADMASTGMYRDYAGKKVIETDGMDSMLKGIGFQPANVARESRAARMDMQDVMLVKNIEAEIAGDIAQGIFTKDKEAVAKAREKLTEWNASNPDQPIIITSQQIMQRVKAMQMSRRERLIKAAPKELRGGLVE